MLRIAVVVLLACNLLLAGVHVTSAPPSPEVPVASPWTLPEGAQEIQLLEEMEFPEPVSQRQCFSAGPFETIQSLIAAREALAPGAVDLAERETEALVELGYWVALPTDGDFAAAHATMQAVDRAGIHDVAVVGDQNGEFRVSLGYFLEEANARRRRDNARSLGFEAETRLQRETQIRFWLDFAYDTPPPAGADAPGQREIPCAEGLYGP